MTTSTDETELDNALAQPAAPETPPTVIQALARAMADVQAVGKKDRNKQQGFSFRGIDAVMNAVGPAFRRHSVVAVPTVTDAVYRDLTSKQGGAMRECVLTVTYRFYGPAGDYIESTVRAEAFDAGDKATAKAHSVAYRTCLLQTLTIPTDEPDPDEHSYERAAPTAPGADPRPEPPDGYLHANEAKRPVLEAARAVPGSEEPPTIEDKALATQAWEAAGLNDREHVTPEEMAKAATLAKLYREQESDALDDNGEPGENEEEPDTLGDSKIWGDPDDAY